MARKRSAPVKSKTSSSTGSSKYLLLAAVSFGLVFIIARGRNSSTSESAIAPLDPKEKSKPVQILTQKPSTVDVERYQTELNQERARFAQIRELGLKALPLKSSGDTITIPLVFKPEKVWCQGGDLDTMKYASKNMAAKEFLISLEGLGRTGKNPSIRTSLEQLHKGVGFSFTLPRPREATAYGLYICSDNRRENSCQAKRLQSHAAMSEELDQNQDQARAEDRIFFFQNLVIDGRSVESFRTDNFSNEFQRRISTHLSKKGLSASEVQTAWQTSSTLKSAPLDIQKGRIVLPLPYNDPRCLQGRSPRLSGG